MKKLLNIDARNKNGASILNPYAGHPYGEKRMKVCPICGRPGILPTDKFCWLHGKEFVQETKCQCGRSLDIHDKYCPACGILLENKASA